MRAGGQEGRVTRLGGIDKLIYDRRPCARCRNARQQGIQPVVARWRTCPGGNAFYSGPCDIPLQFGLRGDSPPMTSHPTIRLSAVARGFVTIIVFREREFVKSAHPRYRRQQTTADNDDNNLRFILLQNVWMRPFGECGKAFHKIHSRLARYYRQLSRKCEFIFQVVIANIRLSLVKIFISRIIIGAI